MRVYVIFLCIFVCDAFDLSREDVVKSEKKESLESQQSDVSKVIAVSYSVMQYFLNKLPDDLKSKILVTDDAEKVVLEHYVRSQSAPSKALDAYALAKKDERELLKRLVKEEPQILVAYKTIRKGVAWNYTRLDEKFTKFFHEPSATLTHYENFKRDELTSLDSFLADSGPSGAPEGATNTSEIGPEIPNLEEKENASEAEITTVDETEKSLDSKETKAEEAEKRKNEELAKSIEQDKTNIEAVTEVKVEEVKKSKAEEARKVKEGEKPKNEEKAEASDTDILKAEDEKILEKSDEPFCGSLKIELNEAEKKEIVRATNDVRRLENATNMLRMTWDNEIAIIAQYKANTCGYFHSMHKDCSQGLLGQNLYSNFKISGHKGYPPTNYTRVIHEWANESVNWDWEKSTCQEGKKCGHWQAVTGAKGWKVGCGIARCPMLDVHGAVKKLANFVVCNYGPFSMDFERGDRCSNCGNSTADMDEKGFTCENELCVQCDPTKKPGCKCGPKYECRNGGEYLAEICGCKCPSEYYGEICEMPCKCDDINPSQCNEHASECKSESQQSWIDITCQKTCNTCNNFPRPASCKSDDNTLPAERMKV